MSQFWNQTTKNLIPYVAGEQPKEGQKIIKLNTNENPYPPAPGIKDFLQNYDPAMLRKYPDPASCELRKEIASFYQVHEDQVFCGNGSDEVLAIAFQAFFETGKLAKPISFCDITYSFYPVYAQLYDIPTHIIPLADDFTVDVSAFLKPSGGVVLANPNAPTGIALSVSQIERILESHPDRLVLIDEAYGAFGKESMIPLIEKYPNLLVTGTVSKAFSLAGLRIGYAIGSQPLIEGLCKVRDSFNSYPVDSLALKIAAIAFKDRNWFEINREKIVKTREYVCSELEKIGFRVLPSQANFIFVQVHCQSVQANNSVKSGFEVEGISSEMFTSERKPDARTLYQILKKKGILVRYFDKHRINDYLRISIGSDDEMDTLIAEIRNIYV